jgi:hypothetical protein
MKKTVYDFVIDDGFGHLLKAYHVDERINFDQFKNEFIFGISKGNILEFGFSEDRPCYRVVYLIPSNDLQK